LYAAEAKMQCALTNRELKGAGHQLRPRVDNPAGKRKCIVAQQFLLLLLLAACLPSFADVAVRDPARETRAMVAQAVAILRNTNIPVERRRREIMKLAEDKLDFARMARGSLGQHWGELTPAQRHRFVALFTGFFEAAYLNKIQDYANLDIRVSDEEFTDHDYARVDAKVMQAGSEDIPITFMLARRGDDWIVYDVAIENVGMIENYRAQFDRIIRAHGISQLMADLQAKQAQLGMLLGHAHGAS
jgi:phospholipid transport system substrate-binding protein